MIVAGAVGAVVAAASLAGASGAAAANDYLQFSLDGETYSSAVAGPVFSEALHYVPGGSSSSSVWVRNNGNEPASLSAGAAMTRSEPELTGYIGLRAGRLPDLSPRTALGAEGTCTDVPQVWNLRAGEELKLDFVADLSADAPNDTMNRTADFDLLFLLGSQEAAPRQACAALAPPGQLPAGPGGGPDSPSTPASPGGDTGAGADAGAGTNTPSATPVILAGSGARPAAAPGGVQTGTGPAPAEGSPRDEVPASPRDVVQAGFQSTVEPIIRSLAGTLLIAMSVALTAAAVLRLRNRQA